MPFPSPPQYRKSINQSTNQPTNQSIRHSCHALLLYPPCLASGKVKDGVAEMRPTSSRTTATHWNHRCPPRDHLVTIRPCVDPTPASITLLADRPETPPVIERSLDRKPIYEISWVFGNDAAVPPASPVTWWGSPAQGTSGSLPWRRVPTLNSTRRPADTSREASHLQQGFVVR